MSQRTALAGRRYNGLVMLERDPQAWVLKALREAGGSLLSELASFDEDILRWRPGEDEWSLKEIAAHLRDAEELAIAQLNAFAAGGSSPLPLLDADGGSSAQPPYRGEVTLGEIARELAQHDLELLWQVRRLKERLRESVAAREDD